MKLHGRTTRRTLRKRKIEGNEKLTEDLLHKKNKVRNWTVGLRVLFQKERGKLFSSTQVPSVKAQRDKRLGCHKGESTGRRTLSVVTRVPADTDTLPSTLGSETHGILVVVRFEPVHESLTVRVREEGLWDTSPVSNRCKFSKTLIPRRDAHVSNSGLILIWKKMRPRLPKVDTS